MSTLTQEQQQRITNWLSTRELSSGLGTEETACSIAAINLVLTGELTDRIPECMSRVIGRWLIRTQDAMPNALRNSAEWKRLLPLAAGTGRKREGLRCALVLDWLWTGVLPALQGVADTRGFGDAWRQMCELKTVDSARSARDAATAIADAANAGIAAADAAYAAADAAYAADAAAAAADAAAAYAADAAAAAYAADAAAAAADAAATAATAAYAAAVARRKFWQKVDPCGLLAKLVEVSA